MRVQEAAYARVWHKLQDMSCVTPFPLDNRERIGAVLETQTPEEAYDLLNNRISMLPGVLLAYPMYVQYDRVE